MALKKPEEEMNAKELLDQASGRFARLSSYTKDPSPLNGRAEPTPKKDPEKDDARRDQSRA